MKLKKANINYKKNKTIFVFIVFVILCILIIMNTRVIKFEILIIIYKLYSLFGNIAWNNRYPIDYPYDRQDIIPEEYMKEFNHICYYLSRCDKIGF